MALKSCVEIGSAKTLLNFIEEVYAISCNLFGENSEKVIPDPYWREFCRLDKHKPTNLSNKEREDSRKFIVFLKGVIVCTEGENNQGSNNSDAQDEELKAHIRKGHELKYKCCYIDLLTEVVKKLLYQDKKQHL